MIKTFACVNDFNLVRDMLNQMNGNDGVVMAGITTALPKSTHVFRNVAIDVVVIDCTYKVTEALSLSEKIRQDDELNLRFVYLVKEMDAGLLDYLIEHENDSTFIQAPFTVGKLQLAIAKEGRAGKGSRMARQNSESFTTQELQNMGLPIHLKGYTYIKSAVLLMYHNYGVVQMPMKQVYKEIARMHASTASRVEKTIRTSIDYAYRISPHLISISGEKPTNSQLIHLICERVLLHELEQKSEEIG